MTPAQTASFYRIPVPKSEYRGGDLSDCADKRTKATVYDYAQGIGNKASPLQQTRRQFPKRIEEDDTVEMAEQVGSNEGATGKR